ncbi:MAG: non-heme iron oxygenase ferredoxin subunit [Ilumatobacteraceae bacterium]|jgi:3-phenylpropionate/trans-cinnamate dioxygenase ferredoxin component|nr:non-heme iron oxygenase ferredoxin subunit [Ilumatobacteraceae bacterium]MDP5068078.1 non-heme iron oxygenase ferredoxin subunit [Ilumatobacteraceae bacterium]
MTVVAKFSELESGTAHKVMVDGVAVAVVRIEDEVFAIADTCSHADISLSLGMVWCETKQIECIKHGSAFNLVTGQPDTFPATQPVAVYSAEVVNDEVIVESQKAKS